MCVCVARWVCLAPVHVCDEVYVNVGRCVLMCGVYDEVYVGVWGLGDEL